MNLYENNSSDLYGNDLMTSKTSDPIQFLLTKVIQQATPNEIKQFASSQQTNTAALDNEVKSKFNIFKENEPQTIGSGKMMQQMTGQKKFYFKRK